MCVHAFVVFHAGRHNANHGFPVHAVQPHVPELMADWRSNRIFYVHEETSNLKYLGRGRKLSIQGLRLLVDAWKIQLPFPVETASSLQHCIQTMEPTQPPALRHKKTHCWSPPNVFVWHFFASMKHNLSNTTHHLSSLTLFFRQIPPQNLPGLHPQEDSPSVLEHGQELNGQLKVMVDTLAGAETCPSLGKCRLAYVGRIHAVRIAKLEVAAV